MNIKKFVLFIVLLFPILIGCSKSTEPDKHSSNITGYVYDAEGIPVPNVVILMEYYFMNADSQFVTPEYKICLDDSIDDPPWDETQLYGNYPNPFYSCTTIGFRIGYPSQCCLYITDFKNKADTVIIFIDEELYPGIHQVCWNGKNSDGKYVENGIYTVYLQTPEVTESCYVFYLKGYDTSTDYHDIACKTYTNEEGKFIISQHDMPFECYVPYFDVDGNLIDTLYVSRYVKYWAFSDYHTPVFVDSVYVDPDKGANIEIHFED